MSNVNIIERDRNVVINPLETCQPLGAMFAVTGINKGIPTCSRITGMFNIC